MEMNGEKNIYKFYDNLPSLDKLKKKAETAERIRKMSEEINEQKNEDEEEDNFSVDLPEDDN